MRSSRLPTVAVFDVALPPGLAFIRSLGHRGVPLRAYASQQRPAGRYSRYVSDFGVAPSALKLGEFHNWLEQAIERDGIDLVAPTSDYVVFAVAEFDRIHGTDLSGGVGGARGAAAVRDCLFKDRFAQLVDDLGFPSPAWSAPTSVDEAIEAGERFNYPVILKPKSHVGIGLARGAVARDEAAVRAGFVPYEIVDPGNESIQSEPDLALPIMQEMIVRSRTRVVSVTGYIDATGELHGVEYTSKIEQWGGELAVGTLFEAVVEPEFAADAIQVARRSIGRGMFEFEVLTDLETGEYWAIELNPRGFGQMSLSIARGSDLPALWYTDATGVDLGQAVAPARPPSHWCFGVPFYAGQAVAIGCGPSRVSALRRVLLTMREPSANAVHSWRDPLPGAVFSAALLRHPGGLVRPYLRAK